MLPEEYRIPMFCGQRGLESQTWPAVSSELWDSVSDSDQKPGDFGVLYDPFGIFGVR